MTTEPMIRACRFTCDYLEASYVDTSYRYTLRRIPFIQDL